MASSESTRAASLALARVIDHALIDRDGRRAGRVDDLLFELRRGGAPEVPLELVLSGIVSGPLPRPTARWAARLFRLCYRVLGLRDPRPAIVPWSRVREIDVMVHLDVDRLEAGLRQVDEACERLVRRIPGAEVKP